jgi:hypothetical protein
MLRKFILSLGALVLITAFTPKALAGETYYGQCAGVSNTMDCASIVIVDKAGPQNDHEWALMDFMQRCNDRVGRYGGNGASGDPNNYNSWVCSANDGTYYTDSYHQELSYDPRTPTPRTYDDVWIDENGYYYEYGSSSSSSSSYSSSSSSSYAESYGYQYSDQYWHEDEYAFPSAYYPEEYYYEESHQSDNDEWYIPVIGMLFGLF